MKPDHNKARKMQQNYTGCHNNNSHNNVLQLATIVVKLLPHQAAVHKITVQYNALQRHMARPNSKKNKIFHKIMLLLMLLLSLPEQTRHFNTTARK